MLVFGPVLFYLISLLFISVITTEVVTESPRSRVEEADCYQGVQDHEENERQQVKKTEVCEEHCNVHLRGSRVLEVTFWYLWQTL